MKAYTDMQQSRKLAKILPLESADMCWIKIDDDESFDGSWEVVSKNSSLIAIDDEPLFCWSLAALLYILPDRTCVYKKTYKDGRVKYKGIAEGIKELILKDNPFDACYELVLKLHEFKML